MRHQLVWLGGSYWGNWSRLPDENCVRSSPFLRFRFKLPALSVSHGEGVRRHPWERLTHADTITLWAFIADDVRRCSSSCAVPCWSCDLQELHFHERASILVLHSACRAWRIGVSLDPCYVHQQLVASPHISIRKRCGSISPGFAGQVLPNHQCPRLFASKID